jgi:NADH:ubiquinone oxidoreductase subunit 4 (subunit M)
MLASLAVIVIFLGVYPSPLINLLTASVNHLAGLLQAGAGTVALLH